MATYISLLRGINVGGQKKILMADLKKIFENLTFKDVTTYIQSGNVIFKTNQSSTNRELALKIEKAIAEKYGFEVPVIIRTEEELTEIISSNPFINNDEFGENNLYVTFLSDVPGQTQLETIKNINYLPDQFKIDGQEVYVYCPVNYGETKLSNKFFEGKLKVFASTRNWRTIKKLLEIAQYK